MNGRPDARAGRGSQIIVELARAREAEAYAIAGIKAQGSVPVNQPRLDSDALWRAGFFCEQ